MTAVAGYAPHLQHEPAFSALVVISDATLGEALADQLANMGADAVTGAAGLAEARAAMAGAPPRDVCVVAATLCDGSGLELVADLRAAGWGPLVVLTARGDSSTIRSTFVAGAQGCLLNSGRLVTADDRLQVVDGSAVSADGPVAAASVAADASPRRAAGGRLSAREEQVLGLVAEGCSNGEIGSALHLSALTVKSHLARIARKLGTGDRARMVTVALRAGIID
jgi:DNA-binding NarL/FixJ family response regulator